MSKQTIPERHIITCDCCGVECKGPNYVHEGRLTLTRAALDYQGCPVSDATVRMDLCDRCNNLIGDAISRVVGSKRADTGSGK